MTIDIFALYFCQAVLCGAGLFGFSVGVFFGYKIVYEK